MSADPVIAEYCEYAAQSGLAAATTVYCRRKSLQRIQARVGTPLLQATPEMLARWRAGLSHLSDQTVLNYVTDARRFYQWAAARGYRNDNPAAGLPVPRRGSRLPRPIAEDHLCQAIICAPARIRIWLVLAAFTGLRAKEIALLRRECVLDTARTPAILVASGATKGRHEHMVPLSPFVLAELADYGPPASGWMFARADGQPGPNTPHTVSRIANRHLRECGIPATLHQLRHYFGTEAYATGQDPLTLAEMMGHRYLDSVRGYVAISQAKAARIVAAMPVPAPLRKAA